MREGTERHVGQETALTSDPQIDQIRDAYKATGQAGVAKYKD